MPRSSTQSIRLAECGSIRTGQSFRKTVLEDPKSHHFVIQTKDLLPGGRISPKLMRISTLAETPKPNVEKQDVLILSRGVRFNAGVVDALKGPTTAQSMFYIIKPNPDCPLKPAFIAAYVNTPPVQEKLKSMATGQTVAHLKVQDLSDLRLPVPSLQKQQAFVDLDAAIAEEEELLDQLKSLRKQQLSALLGRL